MAGAVTIRGAATVGCSLLALGCVGAFALSGAPGMLAVGLGGNLLANWIDRYGPNKLASLLTGPLSLPKHDDMVRVADLALSCALKALLKEMEPAFNSMGRAGADFGNCLKIWRNEAESHTRLASTEAAAAITTALTHLSDQTPTQALNQLLADAIAPDLRHTGNSAYMTAWQGLADRLRSRLPELLIAYVAEALKTDERFFRAVTLTQQSAMVETGQDVLAAVQAQGEQLRALQADLAAAMAKNESQDSVTDFRTAITAQLSALQSAIQVEFDNDRAPPLTWPAPSQQAGQELSLLYYDRKARFVGRDAALAALNQFIDDPAAVLWTSITGGAGVGKSRLVLEALSLRRLTGGVEATFLPPSAGWLMAKRYESWCAPVPTVLVIDYAGVSPELIRDLIDNLACRTDAQALRAPVRLLLLDTQPNQGEFALPNRIKDSTEKGRRAADMEWSHAARTTLDLRPLSNADLLSITALYRGDAPMTTAEVKKVTAAVKADPELGRPLFAALMGLALRHDTDTPLTLAGVTSHFLDRQEKHWAERDRITPLDRTLLALATLGGSVPLVEVLNDPLLADLLPTTAKPHRPTLRQHWSVMTGKPLPDANLTKLEPDYVGGLYLLRHLKQAGPGDPREPDEVAAEVERLIILAWKHGDPVEPLINLTRNFAGDPSLSALVEKLVTWQPDIDHWADWAPTIIVCLPWVRAKQSLQCILDALADLTGLQTNNLSVYSNGTTSTRSSTHHDARHQGRKGLPDGEHLFVSQAKQIIAKAIVNITFFPTADTNYTKILLSNFSILEEIYSESRDISTSYARALRNASNHAKPANWRDSIIDDLESLQLRNLNNFDIAVELASSLVNALHDVGSNDARSELLLRKLEYCAQKYKTNEQIQTLFAKGIVNAHSYVPIGSRNSHIFLCLLRQLYVNNPDNPEISTQLALMLAKSFNYNCARKIPADNIMEEINQLATKFPNLTDIRNTYISASINAIHYAGNDSERINSLLQGFEGWRTRFPADVDIPWYLAMGLVNAANGLILDRRKLNSMLDRLHQLGAINPGDPRITHQRAMGLLISLKATEKRRAPIDKHLIEIEKFATQYPGEPLVRSEMLPWLARARTRRRK